jgi:hypothetical protein
LIDKYFFTFVKHKIHMKEVSITYIKTENKINHHT